MSNPSKVEAITVEGTAGVFTTLDVSKILFFWQKVKEDKCYRQCVTQIVSLPDTFPSRQNKQRSEETAAHLEDASCREAMPITMMSWRIQKIHNLEGLLEHGYDVRYASLTEIQSSLDETQNMISEASPTAKFITLHRAYTNEDDRVILPYPTLLTDTVLEIKRVESDLPYIDGEDLGWQACYQQSQQGFPQHRVLAAGGGGLVDGLPQTWLGVAGMFGIQLLKSIAEIGQAVEAVASTAS